jgi:hypothetical protein
MVYCQLLRWSDDDEHGGFMDGRKSLMVRVEAVGKARLFLLARVALRATLPSHPNPSTSLGRLSPLA